MTGISRSGGTQLSVAALGDPDKIKYLKAIVPVATVASLYDNNFQDGVPYFLLAPPSSSGFFVQHSIVEAPGDGATPAHYIESARLPRGASGGLVEPHR